MKPADLVIGGRIAVPRVHRGRLFRKYFLLILALVCGVLLVSGGIGLYFSYQENKSALASLQQEKAVAAASRIEDFVRQIEKQLSFAALAQLGADGVEQRRIEFLKLLNQVPAVTDIAQLDAKGRELLSESRLAISTVGSMKDRSQDPAFLGAKPGQTWFGPVNFRKETEPYMTIAVRSRGEAGAVTVADVNLKFIWDVVTRIKIGDKGKAYVVDGTGHLVADPDIGLVLRKTDYSGLEHVKAALSGPATLEAPARLARDLSGKEVLTAYAGIEPLGWKVFVEQPVAEVYATLNATIMRTGVLMVAGLLFSALTALWLARGLVRPIRTLQEGAQRIGAGELEQRIEVKTGDELETLADQFNDMTVKLRESYGGLERKVEERTGELTESLEYQTAISTVLRVISESPTDVTPVFQAILESAMRLFDSPFPAVFRYDGRLLHLVATRNWAPEAIEDARRIYPGPPNPQMMSGRVIKAGKVLTIEDTQSDPLYDKTTANAGHWRRMLGAPMLKDGVPIGAIIVAWPDPGKTPDRQVDLLKTFADQAVIAIENVRLINETKEALEQQTAISEILRVISGSPTDVTPVLNAVARHAARLCESPDARIFFAEGEILRLVAGAGLAPSLNLGETMPFSRGTVTGRAVIDREAVHVEDLASVPEAEYPTARELQKRLGHRTTLAVPLLREDKAFGAILLRRMEVRPFSAKQIALVKTFADQAAISIENVRLFNETRESLEQQKASAEILRVISSSPTNVQPVFEAIAQSGLHLFEDASVWVVLRDGDTIQAAAISERDPVRIAKWRAAFPTPLTRGYLNATAILDKEIVDVPDVQALPQPLKPGTANFAATGYRAVTITPMMRGGEGIGAIGVARVRPGPLGPKQIALLQTFADQAVIAIENVRLFNETKEALEQQTATAEILRVISSSPTDVRPVFDAVVRSALRLFDGFSVGVQLVRPDGIHLEAGGSNAPREVDFESIRRDFYPFAIDRESVIGRAILERTVQSVSDTQAEDVAPRTKTVSARMGYRSILMAPMLREGQAIGAVSVTRGEPTVFTEKQIALLRTFADQAVIAIQNARLFREIQEKSRQLEIADKHKSEFLANMSHELRTPLNAIIGFSEVLIERMFGELNEKQDDYLKDIHSSGKHLLSLINDILDLSKIEAGRMELDIASFDAASALSNAMTLVRERAQRHGITLGLATDPQLGEIRADERKFKQILLNLLSNAVKFTPDGGRVDVRARFNGGMFEVSVQDTGIGIAKQDQEAVFEEFRQVGRDYTNKQEGTGLGLALTKRFVELHGGTIRLESEPGKGSIFTFTVPSQP